MVSFTFTNLIALISVARFVAASPMVVPDAKQVLNILEKRQSTCAGTWPVLCAQVGDRCYGCELGYRCLADNSCCPIGENCVSELPCINAGLTPPDAATTACRTRAPLCTTEGGRPLCYGSISDWLTLSAAMNPATTVPPMTTSEPPAVETSTTSSTSIYEPPSVSTEPTYSAPPETYTYTEPTTAPTATYETTTYAPPASTYVPPPASNTTVVSPPVATGGASKNNLGLSVVSGFMLLAVFLF